MLGRSVETTPAGNAALNSLQSANDERLDSPGMTERSRTPLTAREILKGVTHMSWQTDTSSHSRVHPSRRWRRIGVALLMGLALTLAACGTSTSGGSGSPT